MMLLSRFRRVPDAAAVVPGPPDPTDPAELGLLLRATRERLELQLDEIRGRIAVPRVDLVALEEGRLSLLHTERAASVALWRYADLLGLDAEALVRIIHTHWPRPTLGTLSIQPFAGIELPVGQIARAQDLLLPIATVGDRSSRSRPLGLSTSTRSTLSAASARRNLGYEILGPVRPSRRRATARRVPVIEDPAPDAEPLAELEAPVEVARSIPLLASGAAASVAVPTPEPADDPAAVTLTIDDRGPEPDSNGTGPAELTDVSDADALAVGTSRSEMAVPSFPSAQVPPPQAPVGKAKQPRDRAARRRLRIPAIRKSALSAAAEDDAALQRLLASVPAERHETLLRTAVDQLEPQEREALRLVIWDELSHAVAAERLSTSEDELLVLLKRARSAFRRALVELANKDA